jgi:hypothetical protein
MEETNSDLTMEGLPTAGSNNSMASLRSGDGGGRAGAGFGGGRYSTGVCT